MKFLISKRIIIIFSFIALTVNIYSQSKQSVDLDSVTQVMVPKELYIGDLGQIQYSFRTPVDFFSIADKEKIHGDELSLDVETSYFLQNVEDCSIENIVLVRNGLNYNLCITFKPWKVGKIEFKEFDLLNLCRGKKQDNFKEEFSSFNIKISSIEIPSTVEKLNINDIKPPKSPLMLPGTKYILLFLAILLIAFLTGIAIAILKLQLIISKYHNFKRRIAYSKNARLTKKELKNLLKIEMEDKDFAQNWQRIIRKYLEFRFSTPFNAVTGNKIASLISSAVGDLLDTLEFDALEVLSTLFIRTDYIRYAMGSIDSQLLPIESHQAEFLPNEKKELIEKTNSIIDIFEGADKRAQN